MNQHAIEQLINCIPSMQNELLSNECEEIFIQRVAQLNQLSDETKNQFVQMLNNDVILNQLIKYGFKFEFIENEIKEVQHLYAEACFRIPLRLISALKINYKNLTKLDLSHQKIDKLPKSIGGLINLKYLGLSDNRLIEIPESFDKLINLKYLGLSNNRLIEIPESFGKLINLKYLYLYDNQIRKLPKSIGKLISITELILNNNRLIEIPAISNLASLTHLYLHHNQLKKLELPNSIGNLTHLYLHNNQIEKLPESIGALINLKYLSLSDNRLIEIPTSVGNLINIEELYLHYNQLTKLPAKTINGLISLKILRLQSNKLTKLPNETGKLNKLEELNLDNNLITELPTTIGNLFNLKELYLRNNPIEGIIYISNENVQVYNNNANDIVIINEENISGRQDCNLICGLDSTIETFESENIEMDNNFPAWCYNDTDPITLETWDNFSPDEVVGIQYPNMQPNQMTCYDRESLITYMQQENSIMFDWIQNPNASVNPMNDIGGGGMPGNECYRREPYNKYITSKSYEYLKNHKEIKMYKAVYLGKKRIGNWVGSMGMSRLHGQAPGEDIYKLIPINVNQ